MLFMTIYDLHDSRLDELLFIIYSNDIHGVPKIQFILRVLNFDLESSTCIWILYNFPMLIWHWQLNGISTKEKEPFN